MDPKYTPTDQGLMHEDGYIIPADEPIMVFRGKDIGALLAIIEYIEMLEDQPQAMPTIVSHTASASERLVAFYCYQINNPELQSVGCSQRSHSDTHYILERARLKLEELGLLGSLSGRAWPTRYPGEAASA